MAIGAISPAGDWNALVSAAFGGIGLRRAGPADPSGLAEGRSRPVAPVDGEASSGDPPVRGIPRDRAEPRSDTAYQRNADGDDATLTSRSDRLTSQEREKVETLRKRDAEVRAHEQAHLAAAGGYARGVSYDYQVGPDGKRYAVGGSVQVDTSPVPGDPAATIAKAQTIRRAALAPAEPSGQDRAVAAAAAQMEAEARATLAREGDRVGEVADNDQAEEKKAQPAPNLTATRSFGIDAYA